MFGLLLQKLWLFALHLEDGFNFPDPLSSKEEQMYLRKMAEGDKRAKDILIERNLRLVAHIVKKYYSSNVENDELISIGTIGLIKGINSYKPDKGVRLSTYVSRCIDNEILMYFRAKKKSALDVSFDEPIEQDGEGNPLTLMDIVATDDTIVDELCLKNDVKRLRLFLAEMTDEREKTILVLRYGLNGKRPLTQNEVAKLYGISRSYVSRIETKALKKLRAKFDS
ncbi:MAG: RNA polymerase sporulation sigma factor SigK [Clostridia bacterium]|nr:RNA polymerase sporulation sigma factor SigK [Clostridia bacterium]